MTDMIDDGNIATDNYGGVPVEIFRPEPDEEIDPAQLDLFGR